MEPKQLNKHIAGTNEYTKYCAKLMSKSKGTAEFTHPSEFTVHPSSLSDRIKNSLKNKQYKAIVLSDSNIRVKMDLGITVGKTYARGSSDSQDTSVVTINASKNVKTGEWEWHMYPDTMERKA